MNKQQVSLSCIDSERAVLGACMIEPNLLDDIELELVPEDFYLNQHQVMFNVLSASIKNGTFTNISDFYTKLSSMPQLSASNVSVNYLMGIAKTGASKNSINEYASVIKKKARLRKFIQTMNSIVEEIREADTHDTDHMIDLAERKITEMSKNAKPISDELDDLASLCNSLKEYLYKETEDVISTGFNNLDEILVGGFKKENLILLARTAFNGENCFRIKFSSQYF